MVQASDSWLDATGGAIALRTLAGGNLGDAMFVGCYFTGNSAENDAGIYIFDNDVSTSGSTNCDDNVGALDTTSGTYYNYNCGGTSAPTSMPTVTALPTAQPGC